MDLKPTDESIFDEESFGSTYSLSSGEEDPPVPLDQFYDQGQDGSVSEDALRDLVTEDDLEQDSISPE